MILLIDNYDSFTYNLKQYLEGFIEVTVIRNDDNRVFEIAEKADAIVLSPGPGKPNEAGYLEEIIKRFSKTKPMLGICLGHQAIGEVYGARVKKANNIRHGKISKMEVKDNELFNALPKEFEIMRYHSLIVEKETIPSNLEILALSTDDKEIMAMKVKDYPVYGLQFHPESIGTMKGIDIIGNFITIVKKEVENYGRNIKESL